LSDCEELVELNHKSGVADFTIGISA